MKVIAVTAGIMVVVLWNVGLTSVDVSLLKQVQDQKQVIEEQDAVLLRLYTAEHQDRKAIKASVDKEHQIIVAVNSIVDALTQGQQQSAPAEDHTSIARGR